MSWWHNTEFRPQDKGYTDDLVTQYAIDFINKSEDSPFFCYVPFHIAHAPLQAKPNDLAGIDPKFAANLPAAKAETNAEEKHHHAAMLHALALPGPLGKHAIVFHGGAPGTYTVYLDNLRLRHADGSTTRIWENGKDTRFKNARETAAFSKIEVRTKLAAEVQ